MNTPIQQTPLFVDLDGTLIKSDLLLESLLLLLKKNPLAIFLLPLWLMRGRANLKAEIAKRVELNTTNMPWNKEFSDFLKVQKKAGRALVLISGSNQHAVAKVAGDTDLFDTHLGSDSETNLTGTNKLEKIRDMNGDAPFSYAGNSSKDIPVWKAATEVILVNCHQQIYVPDAGQTIHHFDNPAPALQQLSRALRPHQWLKNGLIFVPLVLAHRINDLPLLLDSLLAFLSFSLCASSVYVLNDLLDLDSDRLHASKKLRPFAAGTLDLRIGIISVPLLLLLAFALAWFLPAAFLQMLLTYWLLTLFYSLFLKKVFLLDVITLALLYTQRLLAGAAAVTVIASPWLLAFSLCLFLGLALVKRTTEVQSAAGDDSVPGRAYKAAHRSMLVITGVSANFAAVLVFGFYIYAPETSALYSAPMILWGVCALLLFLLIRLWQRALSGNLQHDPILFAVSDRPSQLVTALMFVVLWLAI